MSDTGFQLGNVSDPDVNVVDISNTDRAVSYVSGMTEDLIRDGHDHPVTWLHNGHADPNERRAAFLLGRGWSCTVDDRHAIDSAGFPTMAINDYPKDGPDPWYWCSGDGPQHYGNRIWDNANVMKFSCVKHTHLIRPREDSYAPKKTPADAPNSHFFHKVNDLLSLDEWLHVPYISWGTTVHGENVPRQFHSSGSGRSSMLIGMRLLWHLGYREVYLIGCDCDPHQHPAPNYWKVMIAYVEKLAPTFRHYGFNVYQTNPHSHLRCFDFVDFKEVIANASKADRTQRYEAAGVPQFNGRLQDQSDNQLEEAAVR